MNIRKTRLWVDCLIWQRPFLRKCLSMGLKILLFIVTQHPVSNLLFSTHQEKSAHRNSAGTVSVAPGEDDVQIPEVRGSWRRSYRPGLGLPSGPSDSPPGGAAQSLPAGSLGACFRVGQAQCWGGVRVPPPGLADGPVTFRRWYGYRLGSL